MTLIYADDELFVKKRYLKMIYLVNCLVADVKETFRLTSVVSNTSVTDTASLPSDQQIQTAHILHHSKTEQDLACVVDLTSHPMLRSP